MIIKRLSYVVVLILIVISCCYLNKSFAATINYKYSHGNFQETEVFYNTKSAPGSNTGFGYNLSYNSPFISFMNDNNILVILPIGGNAISIGISNLGEGT